MGVCIVYNFDDFGDNFFFKIINGDFIRNNKIIFKFKQIILKEIGDINIL